MDPQTVLEKVPNFIEFALAVFDSLPFFIAINAENRIVYIGKEYADALGIPQSKLIGQKVLDVLPWSELPEVVRTENGKSGCIQVLYPDRGLAPESNNVCSRHPIRMGGKVIGAVGITSFTSFRQLFEVAEEARQMQRRKAEQVDRAQQPNRLIGDSPVMEELRQTIRQVAGSDISVYISGETGTGKELIANAIHYNSPRKNGPFVKLNCASIPKDLLESELFGYAPGTFTGASRIGKKGKFEQANGGTILLDEIGEMSMDLQSKLLRVLQEKQIEPLGSSKPVELDIRVISSTNRNLWKAVEQGTFRMDLLYRLNPMEIVSPPLRSHLEDLSQLCEHFISTNNLLNGTNVLRMSEDAYDLFRRYSWPGNVRELQNALARVCVIKQSGILTAADFKFLLSRMAQTDLLERPNQHNPLKQNVAQAEIESIISALISAKGNKSAAAHALGVNRTTLYSKLKQYGITYTP